MTTVYLALKHPQHPYGRGHLEAGTVEAAFDSKMVAEEFVAEKNKRATYNLWSVKAKKVKPSNAELARAQRLHGGAD